MEWLNKILDGVENAEEIANKICAELPKSFIPKEKYNEVIEAKRQLTEQGNVDFEGKVRSIAINSAMKALSSELKIKDLDVVKMLIDVDSVTISDDGLTVGLDEQIKQIQKQKPYLFGDDTLSGRTPIIGGGAPSGVSKEQFAKMGYRDRLELYNNNPELYENLAQN